MRSLAGIGVFVVLEGAALGMATLASTAWATTNWVTPLGAGSTAEAQADGAPPAPGGVTATCPSPSSKKVTVTWSAVPTAAGYALYESTTGSSSGFALVAGGVPGTSWTSGKLPAGTYWFEVTAYVGANWTSAASAATGATTINTSSPYCTQP